jgi:lipid-binding SYLF domain-containing protein
MKYILPLILGLCAIGCANPRGATTPEQRDYVVKMHDQTLSELYSQNPEAREKVASAAGHAVFSYFGTNLIFLATEGGFGMVVDHQTDQKTFMRQAGGGLGIGWGIKDARVVLVFASKAALDEFVAESGKFTVGAYADAIAKSDDHGGAKSRAAKSGQVQVYTINRNGFALAASVIGTRFYRDAVLNAPDENTPNPGTETVVQTVDLDCEVDCPDPAEANKTAESTKTAESSKPAESQNTAETQPAEGYDD